MSAWPKSDVCSACRFYTYNDDECGDCQRYPPSVECDGDVCFPVVGRLSWCGEFKPVVDKIPPNAKFANCKVEDFWPDAKPEDTRYIVFPKDHPLQPPQIGDAYPGSEGATV